jgi:hypothetical protein
MQTPVPAEHQIAVVVGRAYAAFTARDGVRLEQAAADLVGRPDVDGWRATVLRELGSHLDTAVADAWERGWQPGDVARMVVRRLGRQHLSLATGAMAAQMTGYAPATVDPRWQAQLDELDARVRWPARQSHLASVIRGPGDWVVVVPAALELLCLLSWLPRVERLMPVPGEYRADDALPRPDVDERVLGRIRALLAKAEATTSAAEAEAFTAGAQERMARYSIDAAMLAAAAPGRSELPGGRRIGIENPYEGAKALLLDSVARANRCRSVWTKQFGFCTVIGHEADVDAVETLFTSLLVQATAALGAASTGSGAGGRARSRSFRSSFLTAYASRIGERLAEVTAEQTAAAARDAAGSGNVLPVLASREAAVDAALHEVFPALTTSRTRAVTDAGGWYSGQAAADRASLAAGQPLRA